MAYTVAWNEAFPAGTNAASLIWEYIQDDKTAVRERIDSIFGTSGSTSFTANVFPYKPISLNLAGGPTSRIIPGATSLSLRNAADDADNVLITDAGSVTIRGGASAARRVATVAATTSIDLSTGNSFYLELGVSITTLTLTNPRAGMFYVFEIKQTGAGSFTIAWPAEFEWPSDVAPTLTTTTGKTDIISAYYNGTKFIALAASLNYSV
jgi:hypothetical protein